MPFVLLIGLHLIPCFTCPLSSQLPPSLYQLTLNDDLADWNIYSWPSASRLQRLHDLLDARFVYRGDHGILPHLEEVELSLEYRPELWLEDDRARFIDLCKRHRVHGSIEG